MVYRHAIRLVLMKGQAEVLERLWEVGKDKKLGRGSTRIPSTSDLWVSCVVYLKTKSRNVV